MFWLWIWALVAGIRPRPFVAIWARGGAKSSSAELAAAAVVMRGVRKYVVYVSATQDLADKHVATIASALEHAGIERAVNKYGSSKGWRRNRLRLANGTTIDALGLDTAARGIKVDQNRPDMMVLDDVDERHDTKETTKKKIETLSQTVLPAGSHDLAVLAVQNVVHANSIFARFAAAPTDPLYTDLLSDRIVSGPIKAVNDLTYETRDGQTVITGGTATWEGQSLAVCQDNIKTWTLSAFLREAQHEVKDAEGALWRRALLDELRVVSVPHLTRVGTGVDPSGAEDATGTEWGIVTAGIGWCDCKHLPDGKRELHAFVLEDPSLAASPNQCARAAVGSYNRNAADIMVAEGNYGGAMVRETLKAVPGHVNIKIVHASRGKQARAEPISALYDEGKVHHVGQFQYLENEMCQWVPNTGAPSPNRLDALVWVLTELMQPGARISETEGTQSEQANKWQVERTGRSEREEDEGSRWTLG